MRAFIFILFTLSLSTAFANPVLTCRQIFANIVDFQHEVNTREARVTVLNNTINAHLLPKGSAAAPVKPVSEAEKTTLGQEIVRLLAEIADFQIRDNLIFSTEKVEDSLGEIADPQIREWMGERLSHLRMNYLLQVSEPMSAEQFQKELAQMEADLKVLAAGHTEIPEYINLQGQATLYRLRENLLYVEALQLKPHLKPTDVLNHHERSQAFVQQLEQISAVTGSHVEKTLDLIQEIATLEASYGMRSEPLTDENLALLARIVLERDPRVEDMVESFIEFEKFGLTGGGSNSLDRTHGFDEILQSIVLTDIQYEAGSYAKVTQRFEDLAHLAQELKEEGKGSINNAALIYLTRTTFINSGPSAMTTMDYYSDVRVEAGRQFVGQNYIMNDLSVAILAQVLLQHSNIQVQSAVKDFVDAREMFKHNEGARDEDYARAVAVSFDLKTSIEAVKDWVDHIQALSGNTIPVVQALQILRVANEESPFTASPVQEKLFQNLVGDLATHPTESQIPIIDLLMDSSTIKKVFNGRADYLSRSRYAPTAIVPGDENTFSPLLGLWIYDVKVEPVWTPAKAPEYRPRKTQEEPPVRAAKPSRWKSVIGFFRGDWLSSGSGSNTGVVSSDPTGWFLFNWTLQNNLFSNLLYSSDNAITDNSGNFRIDTPPDLTPAGGAGEAVGGAGNGNVDINIDTGRASGGGDFGSGM